jgi:hypothetical protein
MSALRWKKFAPWNLGRGQQVVWTAIGRDVEYKVTRAGTADKPSWALYTRRSDAVEEQHCVSNRLRDVKYAAESMEARGDSK